MMNSNKTSQYNAYKKMLVALLLTSSMGVMTGCGSEEKEPEINKVTEKEKEEKKEDVSIWASENKNIEIFADNDFNTINTDKLEGEELGGYSSMCILSTSTPNPIQSNNLQGVNDELYVIFYQHFEESSSYIAVPYYYGEDALNNLSEYTVMAKIISNKKIDGNAINNVITSFYGPNEIGKVYVVSNYAESKSSMNELGIFQNP